MAKVVKGNPRRKPPEPSADHFPVEAWLGEVVPAMQPIVRELDEAIRAVIPDLLYGVKFHRAFYGRRERGWIIEIAPYLKSVNVLFLGGADFDHPPPLGDVGRTRYVKLNAVEEVHRSDLRMWMQMAGRTAGWT